MDGRGASRLPANLALLGLIALILYAVYLMNQNKVRTAEAMKRVEAIHQSITRWQGEASGRAAHGGGTPIPDVTGDLAPAHPEEAEWLLEGDVYYKYEFSGLRYEAGKVYPLVSATARDPASVFGEVIISRGDGSATIGRVSQAGREFSPVDFARDYPVVVGALIVLATGSFLLNRRV
jgi:hypothetical protein